MYFSSSLCLFCNEKLKTKLLHKSLMGADIKIRHLVTDGLFLLLFSFFFKLAMLNELQNFMLENGIAVFWGFFHADILLQMCGFFFNIS